jgi:AraC-like DNA-binding protein
MLKNINKIMGTAKKGRVDFANAVDMGEPSARPLSNIGIKACALSSIKDHYKILNDGSSRTSIVLIIFLIDGEVEFETDSGDFYAKPGYLLLYPGSVRRRLELVKGDRYTELMFSVDGAVNNAFKSPQVTVKKSEVMPQMLDAFRGYVQETSLRKFDYMKASTSFANQMGVYLAREMHFDNAPAKSVMDSAMEKLWDAVRLQPQEDWTVDKMASFVNSSPSNFFRMVEKQKGFSPKKYVTEIRMEKSKMLIENGSYTLKGIADALGYSSEYSFSNIFYQHTGIRPGAYGRKQTAKSK